MKLALGTVQFGMSYGIHNSHGVPSDEEMAQLLSIAAKNHIHTLDTAYAYGNAEERLGQHDITSFRIVSKFPTPENGKSVPDYFTHSCNRLKCEKLYAYMAHNAAILLSNPHCWLELQQLKEKGKVTKIGYSLYHPNELEQLLERGMKPDIVQIPYSLLDRKFETAFALLKAIGCEIHTRSTFLQGLYFMNPEQLPSKLQPLKDALLSLHRIADNYALTMEALALQFVSAQPAIHQIVIGSEAPQQLQANIAAVSGILPNGAIEEIEAIELHQPELLNPSVWHA